MEVPVLQVPLLRSLISGNNTITLVSLGDGTYSNWTIIVTDSAGNVSNIVDPINETMC